MALAPAAPLGSLTSGHTSVPGALTSPLQALGRRRPWPCFPLKLVWCLSRHLSSFVCNDGALLYQILSLAMKSLNLRIQDVQTLQQKHFALNMGKLKPRGYLSQNQWPINNKVGARTQEGVGSLCPASPVNCEFLGL